jgi:hypothetical protein
VQLVDAGFLGRVLDGLRAATVATGSAASGPPVMPEPRLEGFDSAPFRGAAAVLFLVAFAIWLATLAWSVAAWGAFRDAFGATRVQAWIATSLWLAMVVGLGSLGARLS